MTEWGRATPWRQGQVFTDQTVDDLDLHDSRMPGSTLVVVISHDCDIASSSEVEADIEVIVGKKVLKADGNFTHAKNPRKIHVELLGGKQTCVAELLAANKRLVSKSSLIEHSPSEDLRLDPIGIGVLQRWLAARYRRAAFPDAFDQRLKNSGLAARIPKIFREPGKHILTVFFDVDDGEEVIRQEPEDTYSLRIHIVYVSEPSPLEAEASALKVKAELESAFKEHFVDAAGKWQNIELIDCDVISDEGLSYRQSQYFKEWRLEYLSLREEPQQPMMQ